MLAVTIRRNFKQQLHFKVILIFDYVPSFFSISYTLQIESVRVYIPNLKIGNSVSFSLAKFINSLFLNRFAYNIFPWYFVKLILQMTIQDTIRVPN